MDRFLIVCFIALFIYREIVNQITIQRLVNKLMSRNYYDYKLTEVTNPSPTKKTEPENIQPYSQSFTDEYNNIGV